MEKYFQNSLFYSYYPPSHIFLQFFSIKKVRKIEVKMLSVLFSAGSNLKIYTPERVMGSPAGLGQGRYKPCRDQALDKIFQFISTCTFCENTTVQPLNINQFAIPLNLDIKKRFAYLWFKNKMTGGARQGSLTGSVAVDIQVIVDSYV